MSSTAGDTADPSQASAASPPPVSTLAENLASKTSFYLQAHALSSDFVRSDIPRRDRMLREFEQSSNAMKMDTSPPDTIEDVDGLLKNYDTMLAQTPITFEDHFSRMHYAFSALALIKQRDVANASQDPNFRPIYSERVAESMNKFMNERYPNLTTAPDPIRESSSSPSSSSLPSQKSPRTTVREDIKETADAVELVRDYAKLMQLKFILSPNTSDEEQWQVVGINLKPDGKTEYIVQFADCGPNTLPPLREDEVVTMLCDSLIQRVI